LFVTKFLQDLKSFFSLNDSPIFSKPHLLTSMVLFSHDQLIPNLLKNQSFLDVTLLLIIVNLGINIGPSLPRKNTKVLLLTEVRKRDRDFDT
jgi:hypothetical protein